MSRALSDAVALAARSVEAFPDETDGALLARFARSGDGSAFTELVRRLGPMVLGVCRRVAGDHHLAEDALQASFLVLARRAADVRPAEAVRGWLYGVAVRTAQEARTVAARRRARELPVATLPEVGAAPAEPTDPEALRALDEEIAGLPAPFRVVVSLCELEGVSRADAAARLGLSEGTLSSRLARARKYLARRLVRRGVTVPAVLASVAHPALSPELFARTAAFSSPDAVVPEAVAALTRKAFRALLLAKLRVAAPFAALAAGLLGAAALLAASTGGPPRPAPAPREATALVAAGSVPKGPNKLVFWRGGKLMTVDPDGTNPVAFELPGKAFGRVGGQFSPDGAWVAAPAVGSRRPAGDGGAVARPTLHVCRSDGAGPGTDLGVEVDSFAWSPDGSEIVCHARVGEPREKGEDERRANLVVNGHTRATRVLPTPPGHAVVRWAPDGQSFLTAVATGDPGKDRSARLYLVNPDGTVRKALTGEADHARDGAFSPDGTRLMYARTRLVPETPVEEMQRRADGRAGPKREFELVVHHLATDRVTQVELPPGGQVVACCWSPDGARIAFAWEEVRRPGGQLAKEPGPRLTVADPDGRNPRTVGSPLRGLQLGPLSSTQASISSVHWR